MGNMFMLFFLSAINWTDVVTAIAGIASLFLSSVAVYWAVKAYKSFEYQIVKPEQINKVLNLIDFTNNFYMNGVYDDGKDENYRKVLFSKGLALSYEVLDGRRTDLTKDCLELEVLFPEQNIFKDFMNFQDDYYLPQTLITYIKHITSGIEKAGVREKGQLLLFFVGPSPENHYHYKTGATLKDVFVKFEDLIRASEEWLYKQGITNLNFQYYKPKKWLNICLK